MSQDSAKDPLLLPTFGQFIDQQLLPLYVRDIQMKYLEEALPTGLVSFKGPCLWVSLIPMDMQL